MDIVIRGRNVEVPEHYRVHVADKMARLERYDRKVIRYEVELFHEPNPRQAKNCQRVEITGRGKGPIVRAEARAGDFYAALDSAISKLESRLRRMHDRRRVHYGRRAPESLAEATAAGALSATPSNRGRSATAVLEAPADTEADQAVSSDALGVPEPRWDDGVASSQPGRVVREKQHSAEPMTIDEALYQMELVGHDFYLFNCADTGKPSVVYRRKGFDYGVIRLG
ncbi:ribosome hibernation-promoting factor, HPF/YfiA family [Saccharomonospora azurea]|uniref:ribosome hibernation-promoting factor, HPF/YfiA family n=1 Tax=Saccharomonospora azurea TaxID=40988 RepID=UPI00023FF0AC|nr:ribosome-associated translation inhibitor RaiA [Saccharomonospora azurea]EHK87208.1 30S ribosomal protein S30P/sigma 54 modulation protein [Saccharomonospora azurea SZMC 14600]